MESGEYFLNAIFEIQREIAFLFSAIHKSTYFLRIYIVIRSDRMSRCIKRNTADDLFLNQIIHERVINSGAQFFIRGKTTADNFLLHLTDESLLFRMTRSIGLQRVRQAMCVVSRCCVVFMFGRRDTLLVLIAILGSKDSKIDMTFGGLRKIRFLCGDLRSRHVFEDKGHKEPPKQAVCADIIA